MYSGVRPQRVINISFEIDEFDHHVLIWSTSRSLYQYKYIKVATEQNKKSKKINK